MSQKRGPSILLLVLGLGACGFGAFLLNYSLGRHPVDQESLQLGLPVFGVGALLLALALARPLGKVLGLLVFLGLAGGAGYLVYAKSRPDTEGDVAAANREYTFYRLFRVCHGWTYPESAAYTPEPGVHPTAIIATTDEGEWQPWRNDHPEGWEPASLAEAELVACVHTDYGDGYGDPSVSDVRIVSVRTGETLGVTQIVQEGTPHEPIIEYARLWVEGSPP